jgi:type 1 fimbria pilin
MPVNSWLNFTLPDQPKLFATLVKRPGGTLTAGYFTSVATMVVDYQ